jgi:cell wall-associated NlpC family hydrolase
MSKPTSPPDPRVHAWRPDLAHSSLRGQVEAERFVDGVPCRIRTGFTALTEQPGFESRQASQLLFGEVFTVLEERDGWAWGQGATDSYVGWLQVEALDMDVPAPTHRVAALRSYLFSEPDLKSPPLDLLSFEGRVTVEAERDGWCGIVGGGWIYRRHLLPVATRTADPAVAALRFAGTPYLWGGRTSLGLDCSALIQLSLAAAGSPCPRDSDQQAAAVGTLVSSDGVGFLWRRNDLVFFPGHVGIMENETHLIHANAFHMAVVSEPLADVLKRAGTKGISAVRRLG